MDPKVYIDQFKSKYVEMMIELCKLFPQNKSLESAANIPLTDKHLKTIIDTYVSCMTPLYKKLSDKDESIFLKAKMTIFPDFNLQKIWNKKLKKINKDVMWQYLQILYLTGTCADNKPTKNNVPDPLNFIRNNINDSKIDEMNNELANLDPEKLKETCSSISSMVGDNDGVISSIFEEIQSELKNPSSTNPPAENESTQMLQQMFGFQGAGFNNLINVFDSVSKKMGKKIESGELNIEQLQVTAQKMMTNLNMQPPPQPDQ